FAVHVFEQKCIPTWLRCQHTREIGGVSFAEELCDQEFACIKVADCFEPKIRPIGENMQEHTAYSPIPLFESPDAMSKLFNLFFKPGRYFGVPRKTRKLCVQWREIC